MSPSFAETSNAGLVFFGLSRDDCAYGVVEKTFKATLALPSLIDRLTIFTFNGLLFRGFWLLEQIFKHVGTSCPAAAYQINVCGTTGWRTGWRTAWLAHCWHTAPIFRRPYPEGSL